MHLQVLVTELYRNYKCLQSIRQNYLGIVSTYKGAIRIIPDCKHPQDLCTNYVHLPIGCELCWELSVLYKQLLFHYQNDIKLNLIEIQLINFDFGKLLKILRVFADGRRFLVRDALTESV